MRAKGQLVKRNPPLLAWQRLYASLVQICADFNVGPELDSRS